MEAIGVMSPTFLLDCLQASKSALTEIVLIENDKQLKQLSDGEALGHFLQVHPLLVLPERITRKAFDQNFCRSTTPCSLTSQLVSYAEDRKCLQNPLLS